MAWLIIAFSSIWMFAACGQSLEPVIVERIIIATPTPQPSPTTSPAPSPSPTATATPEPLPTAQSATRAIHGQTAEGLYGIIQESMNEISSDLTDVSTYLSDTDRVRSLMIDISVKCFLVAVAFKSLIDIDRSNLSWPVLQTSFHVFCDYASEAANALAAEDIDAFEPALERSRGAIAATQKAFQRQDHDR